MFKDISDSELVSKTKVLVSEERRITARVLEHLEEIERRKLHLVRHSSMFAFCIGEFGYSRDEAQLRISAMRLSRDVPEVVTALEEGRLCLTNLSMAQSYFRKNPVSVEAKRELLEELEGMSTRECEKRLSPEGLMKKTFMVDEALLSDLERIRGLWGNQDLSDTELLRKMAKLVLARIDPGLRKERAVKSVGAPQVGQKLTGTPPVFDFPENRHIPEKVKREVWARDEGRCTYAHADWRCDSRNALQFDHLDLYAYGGAHTASNLRLLCRSHHRLRTLKEVC